MVHVVLLGTGTPNPDPDRSGSSVAVVAGDRWLLVDCGRGVAQRVLQAEFADIAGFVDVRRRHIEAFKLFFAAHLTVKGVPPARNTIRQRFGMLRSFFHRIIEWDWPDAPVRIPIFGVDVPVADDPLPRFLDDAQAARLAHRDARW